MIGFAVTPLGRTCWLSPLQTQPQALLRVPPAELKRIRIPSRALLDPSVAVVLSHAEAAALLSLKRSRPIEHADRKAQAPVCDNESGTQVLGDWTVNLGRDSVQSVRVCRHGVVFEPPGEDVSRAKADAHSCLLTFEDLTKMAKKNRVGAYECFFDPDISPRRIADISPNTRRPASLQPLVDGKPPTVILGGFGMHRFKGTDPAADTEAKVDALGGDTLSGPILDVCTGLGYTAMALANKPSVTSVTTIELDQVMVDMQRRNPWSEELFLHPKICRIVADAVTALPDLPANSFHAVLHDPPAHAIAGELYSTQFYKHMANVLVPTGKIFHYIGDPDSAESGRLYRGITQRLQVAGFTNIGIARSAFGVVASLTSD